MATIGKKGFTLVEIIITLAIASLIALLALAAYSVAQKTYLKADNKAEITQNGRVILDRLSRELRQAIAITTSLPANNSNPSLTPSEIVFEDGHDITRVAYIRYYLSGTEMKRQTLAYYFPSSPTVYVRYTDRQTGAPTTPPQMTILDEKLIGEFISDIGFWGGSPVYINIELNKLGETANIFSAVYPRN